MPPSERGWLGINSMAQIGRTSRSRKFSYFGNDFEDESCEYMHGRSESLLQSTEKAVHFLWRHDWTPIHWDKLDRRTADLKEIFTYSSCTPPWGRCIWHRWQMPPTPGCHSVSKWTCEKVIHTWSCDLAWQGWNSKEVSIQPCLPIQLEQAR